LLQATVSWMGDASVGMITTARDAPARRPTPLPRSGLASMDSSRRGQAVDARQHRDRATERFNVQIIVVVTANTLKQRIVGSGAATRIPCATFAACR